DALAHRVDDLLVVGGHHDGSPPGIDLFKQIHDVPGVLRIQVAGGLVRDQEARVVYDRPGNGNPLLFAPRQLGRQCVHPVRQAHQFQDLLDPAADLATGGFNGFHGKRNVFIGRQVGQQLVILENHPDFSAQIGNLPIPDPLDVDSVDQDDAAGRLLFTVHQFDEGTLPGATWTDHIAKLSLVNPNVDAPKSLHTVGIYLRSEEHTSELQSRENLVCRLLLEKKK